MITLQTLQTN